MRSCTSPNILYLEVLNVATHVFIGCYGVISRAGLKGKGAHGNFYWRALWRNSWRYPLKVVFSLISKVPVCFLR